MTIKTSEQDNTCILEFSGEMVIHNISECKSQLLALLQSLQSKSIKLNLKEVEEFDSTGFQLLVALQKHCKENGITLQLDELSASVKTVFELYRYEL